MSWEDVSKLEILTCIMESPILDATTSVDNVRTILIPSVLISENKFYLRPYFSKIKSYIGGNSTNTESIKIVSSSCHKKNCKFFYK